MPRIIVTAEADNSSDWSTSFLTHGELFKDYTATAVHFGTAGDNDVATYWEVDDVDEYMKHLDSPATAEAMAADGIRRETVRIFVLDGEVSL